MKKSFTNYLKIFLIILIIPCIVLLSACSFSNEKTIRSIEKTSSSGLVDTYTIYYTDNTTTTFNITNGKNGEDAEKIGIEEIYNKVKEKGYTGSFDDFIKDYLSYEVKSSDRTQSINKAILSAVSVYSESKVLTEEPVYSETIFGQVQVGTKQVKDTQVGAGSGVIYKLDKVSGDAYIITNYHVVYNKNGQDNKIGKSRVFLYGALNNVYYKTDENNNKVLDSDGYPVVVYSEDAIECSYVGGSLNYDIAVLKVTNSDVLKNSSAEAVTVADNYYVGDTAIAIGNPEAEGISVTEGVVSVESEYISMTGVDGVTNVTFRTIRIDTAINSGNSGGGLFNEHGELIGIVNAKLVSTEIENIAYAIPRDIAINIANNLIYNFETNSTNKVYKITVGLGLEIKESTSVYNLETKTTQIKEKVVIRSVANNSLASKSAFKENDVLKTITISHKISETGTETKTYNINRMFNAIDLALTIKVGDSVTYEVVRDNITTPISFVATSEYFGFVE